MILTTFLVHSKNWLEPKTNTITITSLFFDWIVSCFRSAGGQAFGVYSFSRRILTFVSWISSWTCNSILSIRTVSRMFEQLSSVQAGNFDIFVFVLWRILFERLKITLIADQNLKLFCPCSRCFRPFQVTDILITDKEQFEQILRVHCLKIDGWLKTQQSCSWSHFFMWLTSRSILSNSGWLRFFIVHVMNF